MYVQKYLVDQGLCSRGEAESLLREGLILVNGKKAKPGIPLSPASIAGRPTDDVVTLAPKALALLTKKTTVAIYKPRGIVCSEVESEGRNVFDIFPQFKHLNTIGRLDKESEGLLLLSNDGLITKRITGDTHDVEKEYEVIVQEHVSNTKLVLMAEGIMLSDGQTLPAQVRAVSRHSFILILREGRNRQIRRMCGALNLTVSSLKRIRIGQLTLGTLRPGNFRKLTFEEISALRNK